MVTISLLTLKIYIDLKFKNKNIQNLWFSKAYTNIYLNWNFLFYFVLKFLFPSFLLQMIDMFIYLLSICSSSYSLSKKKMFFFLLVMLRITFTVCQQLIVNLSLPMNPNIELVALFVKLIMPSQTSKVRIPIIFRDATCFPNEPITVISKKICIISTLLKFCDSAGYLIRKFIT